MPVYNRRTLRQTLGQRYIRDTILGQTSGSWGTQAGSLNIIDSAQADPTASGEQLYYRAYLTLLGSAGLIQDLRVGSFNTGSGAYLAAITAATTIFSGMPFEIATLIGRAEKDAMLDEIIQDVRVGPIEVPIWAVQDARVYSLGTDILEVLDVKYFSDPTGSIFADRGEHRFDWFSWVQTQTGQELRVIPALPLSYQLIISAITAVTLGAGDLATVNLLDPEPVYWGATARCLWMIEQRAPGQEAGRFRERRREAATAYTRLMARYQPFITRPIKPDELW